MPTSDGRPAPWFDTRFDLTARGHDGRREIYAGKIFTAGMGIRLASMGVGVLALAELERCTFPLVETGGCSKGGSGGALLILATLGYTAGILYDVATAGRAVDDYNERLRVRVTPTVIPTASSGPAVSLSITGSF